MELGIKGKTALVTGASAGLGFAAAMALSREGADVFINSRSEENLIKAADEIEEKIKSRPQIIEGDVSKSGESEHIVEQVIKKAGTVEILVSNAGGPPPGEFMQLTKEDWADSSRLTLFPAVDLSRAVIPGMIEKKWGRIIFITSLAVKQPSQGLILSNTYRTGVTGFAKSISNELGQHGITVNTVCPGYTQTERLNYLAEKQAVITGVKPKDMFDAWIANIPAGRLGRPDELASLICFLASDKAAYITGTNIPVDGGAIKGLL